MTGRLARVVAVVPFVPLRTRVAAGAVSGVATALDAALKPRSRNPVTAKPEPADDEIMRNPALLASDAAAALAEGAIAAGRVIATRTPRRVGRALKIGVATCLVAVAAAMAYVRVVRPALGRRAARRAEAEALAAAARAGQSAEQSAVQDAESGAGVESGAAADRVAGSS